MPVHFQNNRNYIPAFYAHHEFLDRRFLQAQYLYVMNLLTYYIIIMGVPNGPFDIELITRTKELISTYSGIYSNTLLMNSLLSLIVLPQQYNARYRNLTYMNKELSQIKELNFII